MASFDFPASPNDNDTYSLNGVIYKYVAAKQRWEIVPTPHNFETTAQLDIRDTANRDRANHTGTQDVSTITGLNSVTTSVTAPSSPIAGDVWWDSETGDKYIYYVDADGGQWVQSSSSSNLLTADVGTAAYLDVEEVATSQQGVKADSALQPGDIGTTVAPVNNPTFTGTALILPNNSRINGVEHFYQSTKPTVRGDGSALGIGDRWWKTDDGTEWFWNGTYWLSPQKVSFTQPIQAITITTGGFPFLFPDTGNILIEYYRVYFFLNPTPLSATDYHVLRLYRGLTVLYDLVIQSSDDGQILNFITKTTPILNLVTSSTSLTCSFRYDAGNGSPPGISSQLIPVSLFYRIIAT